MCREALSRWSTAEKELTAVENKNKSVMTVGSSQTYDDFIKKLIDKWLLI